MRYKELDHRKVSRTRLDVVGYRVREEDGGQLLPRHSGAAQPNPEPVSFDDRQRWTPVPDRR